jgi:hypothetical protein
MNDLTLDRYMSFGLSDMRLRYRSDSVSDGYLSFDASTSRPGSYGAMYSYPPYFLNYILAWLG